MTLFVPDFVFFQCHCFVTLPMSHGNILFTVWLPYWRLALARLTVASMYTMHINTPVYLFLSEYSDSWSYNPSKLCPFVVAKLVNVFLSNVLVQWTVANLTCLSLMTFLIWPRSCILISELLALVSGLFVWMSNLDFPWKLWIQGVFGVLLEPSSRQPHSLSDLF